MAQLVEPAVRAAGLVKHFDDGNDTVEAVRGVDLEIQTGEIFGFLGPNGAGKSTTVRMLTTLLSITDGTAEVAGIDVTHDPGAGRTRGRGGPGDQGLLRRHAAPARPGGGARPRAGGSLPRPSRPRGSTPRAG